MPFESVTEPMSRWPRRAARVLILLAAITVIAAGALGGVPAAYADGPAVGKPAPQLMLRTLDGQTIDTATLRGKVVILSFWATWCGPCREELPLLSAYAAQHTTEGLQVVGVSLDDADNLAAVRNAAAGLSFPVGLLGSAWAEGYGRIWRLPVNFTIDRSGILVDNSWNDEQPEWTEARLRRIVTPLLASPHA